ncbi:MAG: hypothetical protein ACLQIJ_16120, partial [Polyangia bacterium]
MIVTGNLDASPTVIGVDAQTLYFSTYDSPPYYLVNNHEPEVLEAHVGLDEAMRADDDVHGSSSQVGQ